jgi:beta-glucosidase
MEPAIDAIYSSRHVSTLDALGVDYYDPVGANHIKRPGRQTAGGRSKSVGSELWDEVVDPAGLTTYIRANIDQSAAAASRRKRPIPLWVVENGLCNRVRRGRSYDRSDGWDRPRYIRENVAAVVDAIDSGLPVTAYLHWTLADNYEWGSYEPRFGIHGVDRERHTKIRDTDAMGRDAAGAYRRVIKGLMEGDRSVLFAK